MSAPMKSGFAFQTLIHLVRADRENRDVDPAAGAGPAEGLGVRCVSSEQDRRAVALEEISIVAVVAAPRKHPPHCPHSGRTDYPLVPPLSLTTSTTTRPSG